MNVSVDRDRQALPALMPHPELFPTGRTVLRAIVVARWLSWAWMVGIIAFSGDDLRHPVAAWAAAGLALAFTAMSTVLVRRRPELMLRPWYAIADIGLAIAFSVLDGYVFEPGHVFETTQSIATQWPLLATASAGLALGPIVAAALGSLIGPAEWVGAVANDYDSFGTRQVVSLVATSIFYAACGAVFGWFARLLRRAEAEVADRRARDEIGRVMHDTVLQTLALVERRTATSDPALAAAAREADRELRAYLFGSASPETTGLEARVRDAVERVRRGHDTSVSVSVIDDGCRLAAEHQELVARAIGEAVANALEHADADRIVVFVETDDAGEVFASVHDDGVGFDAAAPRSTHGLDQSIIARIESIGGRVSITSGSAGTEVCMWSSADASA